MNVECRRYKRFKFNRPAKIMLIDGNNKNRRSGFFHLRTWDISLSGASILTPLFSLDSFSFFYDQIPIIPNLILMKLNIWQNEKPITALGYAVHCRLLRINGHEKYCVGINFLQTGRLDGHRLRLCLNEREPFYA